MHGPGEPDKPDKYDKDIEDKKVDNDAGRDLKSKYLENLLNSDQPNDVTRAIELIHEHYGLLIWLIICKSFPGLSPEDKADLYQASICRLLALARKGYFGKERKVSKKDEKQDSVLNVLGLVILIVRCDAIDFLRQNARRRVVQLDDQDSVTIIRFDDPHDLKDLLTVIHDYSDKHLSDLEKVVLRTYVRLVCKGYATGTGRMSLSLLTNEVNKVIRPQRLSKATVRALYRSGRRKLRKFLARRGFFR